MDELENERKKLQTHFEIIMDDNKQLKDENHKFEQIIEKNRIEYEEAMRNSLLIDEKRKDLTLPHFPGKDTTYNNETLHI